MLFESNILSCLYYCVDYSNIEYQDGIFKTSLKITLKIKWLNLVFDIDFMALNRSNITCVKHRFQVHEDLCQFKSSWPSYLNLENFLHGTNNLSKNNMNNRFAYCKYLNALKKINSMSELRESTCNMDRNKYCKSPICVFFFFGTLVFQVICVQTYESSQSA